MHKLTVNRIKLGLALITLVFTGTALAKTHEVDQLDRSFKIDGEKVSVINIKVGDQITFLNKDTVFHNIFSMSDINKFNFGAYGKGGSKTVAFNRAGKGSVECAIHPRMVLEVNVEK